MLLALPNLSSNRATPVKPWEFRTNIPPEARQSKVTFVAWLTAPTTQHCVFSAIEGVDPQMRIGKSNPVAAIHGFVADFDAKVTKEQREGVATTSPTELVPNWVCGTFSGGARAVWLFEQPVPLLGLDLIHEFLRVAGKQMKLNRLLPGFDKDAFEDPAKYYEAGSDWKFIHALTIQKGFIYQWLYTAGDRLIWRPRDLSAIPIADVARELAKQFPNKWQGGFELGARGVRFWDETADNDTSAVVRETGMQCFTGPKAFVTWTEIFGLKFTEKYEQDRTQAIMENTFYDGQDYWRKNTDGKWRSFSKEDYKLYLKVRHGLSSSTSRKETSSEVDRMLFQIQEHHSVDAALPFMHFPPGLFWFEGRRHLNISDVPVVAPATTEVVEWGQGFPWIAEFLHNLFDPHNQLKFFLAWLKHFYENAYNHTPRLGQAIFLAGDVGVGKTMLSNLLISRMVGGHADASDFLLGESKFTSHILTTPLMTVDDTAPASDIARHARYSSMIKKIVANQHQQYEKKFQAAGQVIWLGRVIVTCNLDPESIRLLPAMDISVLDKISLFRCRSRTRNWPPNDVLDATINQELPSLCRWLINWVIPAECAGSARFGVKSYQEPRLYQNALQSGASHSFLELLMSFLDEFKRGLATGKEPIWVGTSTELLSQMLGDNMPTRELARMYNPSQVASCLGQLKARGYPFERVRLGHGGGRRLWSIPAEFHGPADEAQAEFEEADYGA